MRVFVFKVCKPQFVVIEIFSVHLISTFKKFSVVYHEFDLPSSCLTSPATVVRIAII